MKSKIILAIALIFSFGSCKKFLDVVPDNVATIDNAFSMRNTAEKYLFTCYSYIPKNGNYIYDPAMIGSDEMWGVQETYAGIIMSKGFQNIVRPYFDSWSGATADAPGMFKGIRDCNIFLENIDRVVELDETERARWKAEVNFLKAYYHFYLLRAYGPIPLIRKNLPISVGVEEAQVERRPVDECVTYIVELLDEAVSDLPDIIEAEATERGRVTKTIAMSIKVRVLAMVASPLFNGNPDYVNFKDHKGIALFNPVYEKEKWKKAADAAKTAIEASHANGNKLYYYSDNNPAASLVSAETNLKMNIRNSITAKWNPESIWANPNNLTALNQGVSQARLDGSTSGLSFASNLAPTLKMAETFYTKNGLPIDEDNSWNYQERFGLQVATANEKYYIREGYTTAKLHFDREPRFYADMAFDGSIWYGQGRKTEDNNWYVQGKLGQYAGPIQGNQYSITGYWPKKLVNVENVYSSTNSYAIVNYPFVEVRLADLYLLYAEALNEYNGPGTEVYHYIDLVRARAGLKGVEDTWTSGFSTNKTKHTTQAGLREIIHQERAIELAFEGQRFWDLKRWKKAVIALTYPVQGWDIRQEEAPNYYTPTTIYNRVFKPRDYFWPIRELDMITNKTLVQNPGW